MKTTLYNIEKQYLEIINEVEELDGELTKELEYKLKINEGQLKQKTIAYLSVIKQKESFNDVIDKEIKRLNSLRKTNTKTIDRLKESILNAVKIYGDIDTGLNKFTTRKSESVIVEDASSLPKPFLVIKYTSNADKKAIKEALKKGDKVRGCYIQENINLKIN